MDSSSSKGELLEKNSVDDSTDAQPIWNGFLNKIGLGGKETGVASVGALSLCYNFNHSRRGQALVFNHNTYHNEAIEARDGTNVDLENIKETFKFLGFDVRAFQDYKYAQITKILKDVASENHEKNDCLAIIVMTHGGQNSIHAYDKEYPTEELWSHFSSDKCKSLAGKPKLFFIQACRGAERDSGTNLKCVGGRTVTDGPSNKNLEKSYRIPNQADFLTIYSTIPGYVSFRNPTNGSAFITHLCSVLKTYSPLPVDLLTMMTLVNRDVRVAIKYESISKSAEEDHAKKQMPFVCHTLLRQIYFFPNKS